VGELMGGLMGELMGEWIWMELFVQMTSIEVHECLTKEFLPWHWMSMQWIG
jgi:hypothetical protein